MGWIWLFGLLILVTGFYGWAKGKATSKSRKKGLVLMLVTEIVGNGLPLVDQTLEPLSFFLLFCSDLFNVFVF